MLSRKHCPFGMKPVGLALALANIAAWRPTVAPVASLLYSAFPHGSLGVDRCDASISGIVYWSPKEMSNLCSHTLCRMKSAWPANRLRDGKCRARTISRLDCFNKTLRLAAVVHFSQTHRLSGQVTPYFGRK